MCLSLCLVGSSTHGAAYTRHWLAMYTGRLSRWNAPISLVMKPAVNMAAHEA